MRDKQKPTDIAEQRYREAFAMFEQAVRDCRTRDDLRPLFRDVNAALDAWKGPLPRYDERTGRTGGPHSLREGE